MHLCNYQIILQPLIIIFTSFLTKKHLNYQWTASERSTELYGRVKNDTSAQEIGRNQVQTVQIFFCAIICSFYYGWHRSSPVQTYSNLSYRSAANKKTNFKIRLLAYQYLVSQFTLYNTLTYFSLVPTPTTTFFTPKTNWKQSGGCGNQIIYVYMHNKTKSTIF